MSATTETRPRRSPSRRILALVIVVTALAGLATTMPGAGADAIADKQAEARQIADKMAALQSRLMDVNAQYEQANYELHLAEQKVADAKALAERTAAEVERRQADLRDFAINAYQSGDGTATFDALFTSDPSAGAEKVSYLDHLSGSKQDLIDAYKGAKVQAQEDAARLAGVQAEAQAKADVIEQARSAAARAAAEQEALNAKVQGELASLVAAENARRAAEAQRAAEAASNGGGGGGGGGITGVRNPPPPTPGAGGAIAQAVSQVGAPYVWGAAGPNAYDCSGLVMWAYGRVGVSLPHYSGAMYAMTTRISASQLQPGDLVFWGAGGSEHVAIYMGGNQLVHAFGAQRGVAVTNLAGWWKPPSGYGRIG
ncbi:MAG: C40 family peptidase [Acidobacteria bacterium]|nr:C40 family peptidase [Acidobacteriota bacterium]